MELNILKTEPVGLLGVGMEMIVNEAMKACLAGSCNSSCSADKKTPQAGCSQISQMVMMNNPDPGTLDPLSSCSVEKAKHSRTVFPSPTLLLQMQGRH